MLLRLLRLPDEFPYDVSCRAGGWGIFGLLEVCVSRSFRNRYSVIESNPRGVWRTCSAAVPQHCSPYPLPESWGYKLQQGMRFFFSQIVKLGALGPSEAYQMLLK
jgi:hypothetical protein